MIGAPELARAAAAALAAVAAEPGVEEAEVFAAWNGQLLARLCYTSHIPSNGVEESKSTEAFGLGIQAVFRDGTNRRVGFGAEPADLSVAGARRALAKARAAAVADPTFVSLPRPGSERRVLADYHDTRLMALGDAGLVALGWAVVGGALRAFAASSRLAELCGPGAGLRGLGLILSGDVTVLQERVAVASTHLGRVETDESTLLLASVTAMVEAADAKGSGWVAATRLDHPVEEAGAEAVEHAIRTAGGIRIPAGEYAVVFGPQPIADLLTNLVLPALHASAFYAGNTPFLGKWGRPVVHPTLSLYDHGALPGAPGSKGITCEGLPTGRTELITRGVLAGLLTNWYEAQRLRRDPEARRKLGVEPEAAAAGLVPRNGFRFAPGGGRHFGVTPGIAATNVFLEGAEPLPREALIRRVAHGLYVGRIWYTYPINGLATGDFTCTVVGDSWVIRDGRLAEPLRANAVRINDNVVRLLSSVVGVSQEVRPTLVWAADEVVHAPDVAVTGVRVEPIAGALPGA